MYDLYEYCTSVHSVEYVLRILRVYDLNNLGTGFKNVHEEACLVKK